MQIYINCNKKWKHTQVFLRPVGRKFLIVLINVSCQNIINLLFDVWQSNKYFKNILLKRFIIFLLIFSITRALSAQQARQYSFTRYNTVTGLASNFVNNVVQDHRGFILLATVNGLQRYDGHKFLSFNSQPGNPSAI